VDVCGISDFARFFAETEPWIADAATTKYGDPDTDAVLLRRLSPCTGPAGSLPRCWSCTARTTPTSRAVRPSGSARRCGQPPRFLLIPDEGHEVHGSGNRAVRP
jgi:hypothetical protein